MIRVIIITGTALALIACKGNKSQPGDNASSAAIDSCANAKKFEYAIEKVSSDPNFTGEIKNYWGDDTTKLDFKHVFSKGEQVKTYFYYENGNVQEEYSFKCGAYHGPQKWYNENGSLAKTIPYSYGYRQGTGKLFNESGRVVQEVTFDKDSVIGEIRVYDENGKLIRTEPFKEE